MQGPEFRPVQSDIAASKVRDNSSVDRRSADRQQKLADLKQRIQAGNYTVDTQALANKIQESGVLND